MATLLKDDAGIPIPQYTNPQGNGFEPMQGAGGAINARVDGLLEAIARLKEAVDTLVADNAELKTLLTTIADNTSN